MIINETPHCYKIDGDSEYNTACRVFEDNGFRWPPGVLSRPQPKSFPVHLILNGSHGQGVLTISYRSLWFPVMDLVTSIASMCVKYDQCSTSGHTPADTGMRWSYCKVCNSDLTFSNGEYK